MPWRTKSSSSMTEILRVFDNSKARMYAATVS